MTAMHRWSTFFGMVTVWIVVTMIVPKFFGLQHFSQWAGMYTDSWCNVRIYSADPESGPDVKNENIMAGMTRTQPVWSAPMHNETSCAIWAQRNLCNRMSQGGWEVKWASPYFKTRYYLEPKNVCEMTIDSSFDWFRHVSI